MIERVRPVLREEVGNLQLRYLVARTFTASLPAYSCCRVRTAVWRLVGFDVGREVVLFGSVRLSGSGPIHRRLHIGDGVWINDGCRIELNAEVVIEENVSLGQDVIVLTSSHEIGRRVRRAGRLRTAPVTLGAGAWIGARSVILPGVRIGAGAVVASGSVVNKDVAPNSVVAGAPAVTTVERLPG